MNNLDKSKNYLLACSFGPDSMALFDMLQKGGYRFSAALVNYHLRRESNDEMNAFISYCKKNNIPYHVKDLVKGVGDINVEAECRKIRYDYFAHLVNDFSYDAVLVAHNQDDLIETYILQKNRQNLPLFYGIQEKTTINNVTIIRPLLSYSKEELTNYCIDNNVPFMIDSSNLTDKYKRNVIRHNIVSKMNKEDRRKIINEIQNKNDELSLMFKKIENIKEGDINAFLSLSLIEQAYYLNMLIKKVNHLLSISLRHVKEINRVLLSSNGNIDIPLSMGFVLRKSYDHFEIVNPINPSYEFVLDIPMKIDNEYFYFDGLSDTKNRGISVNDYPLTIRTYKPGDTYQIKDYIVPVRRLFIDWKMPLTLRKRWPIFINKDGVIIYIPRYRKDFSIDNETNLYVK